MGNEQLEDDLMAAVAWLVALKDRLRDNPAVSSKFNAGGAETLGRVMQAAQKWEAHQTRQSADAERLDYLEQNASTTKRMPTGWLVVGEEMGEFALLPTLREAIDANIQWRRLTAERGGK